VDQQPWLLPTRRQHLDAVISTTSGTALDIGCGDGFFVRALLAHGIDAVGVECGAEMLRRAHRADADHPERYIDAPGQDLPFDDNSFDTAFFLFSLHHVPADDIATALHEATRVVRSGGVVHIFEPIAKGLGHEVDALVDDETHVRALAQEAIDAELVGRYDEVDNRTLILGSSYDDFDAYADVLVGIDPARAEVLAGNRDIVSATFYANAIEHGASHW